VIVARAGYVPIVDPIDEAALQHALSDACSEAADRQSQNLVSVASVLRSSAAGEDDPLRALVAGLEYNLILDDERRGDGGPFGPTIEANGQCYPAPVGRIEDIVPGIYSLWERAMGLAPMCLVRARFADLLWEARRGDRPHEFAQAAIDSYIEALGEGFGHPVELSEAIRRAVELASSINDGARRAAAIEAAVKLSETAIDASAPMPGVALPLLAMFVADRSDRRPQNLDQLLKAAINRFGDDPWNLESALELQATLVEPDERESLRARSVEAFRDLAHRSEGLVKYAHLQHAIETAEAYGLSALAEDVRREVEAMTEDEFDLTLVSAEVTLPREEVDQFIEWFVGDDNVESALTRFGGHLPTGDTAQNREFVERLMAEHPLQFLFTRVQIGPENSLVRQTAGQDEQAERALVEHEVQRASMFSIFAVEILDGIRSRYGPVAGASAWFNSVLIEAAVAAKVGRAIELYEGGDFDSSASVLAPRLERVVRRLAGAVGLSVTRSPDRRGRSGGVKGLGELLSALDGALPEATRRYLKALLVDVGGLNLRNRVGHALDDEIAQRDAALLIQCACHLRLLASAEHTGGAE
jgi:hypothetical protein